MYHKLKRVNSQGFTLLEMLIAIAIFAMLGLAANGILQTVMKNEEVTKDFAKHLQEMQQGFGIISRDLGQMVGRTPRLLEGGRGSASFNAGSKVLDSESEGLTFYRIGWLNPEGMLPRGTIQAVAYVHIDEKLERWYYPYPDPEIGSEPKKSVIMNNVESVAFSFFDGKSWQQESNGKELPKAIAIEIEFTGIGKIQRKYLLPELSTNSSSSGGTDRDRDTDRNKS